MDKVYACIDLKSFYASCECVERHLDPLKTNLVVADKERTEKTICLAVTPTLKSYGIGGRSRLYEVVAKVKDINRKRKKDINYKNFTGKSYINEEILNNKYLELDYIIAVPRMRLYIEYSSKIYSIYLKYISKNDIYVYSIDEVFIDLTPYLKYYNTTPEDLITMIIKDVYTTTGITATGGIGTNLYLAKVAMDIKAKKMKENDFGVRIAYLDEELYRKELWDHKPLSDFWRIGSNIERKLNTYFMHTMKDIAICSIEDENLLYKLFGVNAELIIDHAWGYEPCTLKDIKGYKPKSSSISQGQVLHHPYDYNKTKIVVEEMIELLSLEMINRKCITDLIGLYIGYDVSNVDDNYEGDVVLDHYGRKVPKSSHSSIRLKYKTNDTKIIKDNLMILFDKIIDKSLLVRRINITLSNLDTESNKSDKVYTQLDLFSEDKQIDLDKEKENVHLQKEIIKIKDRYGKNSILKGINLLEGATSIMRNNEVGGHRG